MILTLMNASIRKLFVETISFFISYSHLKYANFTFKGHLKSLFEKLKCLLSQLDIIYLQVYNLYYKKLPILYELPNFDDIFEVMKDTGNTIGKFQTMIKLSHDIKKYLHICDIIDLIVTNDAQYEIISDRIFLMLNKDLFELMINVVSHKSRRQVVNAITKQSFYIDVLYPSYCRYGNNFYEELKIMKQRMKNFKSISYESVL